MFNKKTKNYHKTKLESYLTGAIFCIIFLSGFLMWGNAKAADQTLYVRDGGEGTNCSDWSTANACDQLSIATALIDRATYDSVTIYVADGTYLGATIDKDVSGEKLITVQKATAADHGTDNVNWDNAYGDGQALFQWITRTNAVSHAAPLRILTSYVTIDGGVLMGAVDDIDSYGFIFKYPEDIETNTSWGANFAGIYAPDTSSSYTVTDVTITRLAVQGPGYLSCMETGAYVCSNGGIQLKGASSTINNINIYNNYISGWTVQITPVKTNNVSIHDNYFYENVGGTGTHGEQIAPDNTANLTIYNNVFYRSTTAAVGFHGLLGSNTGSKVYNNIIWRHRGYGGATKLTVGIGNNDTGKTDVIVGAEIHHNTFVDIDFGVASQSGTLTSADNHSHAYNNIFYNCINPALNNTGFTAGGMAYDNNAFLKCTWNAGISSTTSQSDNWQRDDSATAPFTTYVENTSLDATINSTTDAANDAQVIGTGKDLGLSYDALGIYLYDYAGKARPHDTTWDVGAYEYVGVSDTTPPASPTGLSVQ